MTTSDNNNRAIADSFGFTGKTIHVATGGYRFVTKNKRTLYLHTLIAERALGKSLPSGAEVHHINGDQSDNRNENLVICNNHEYHSLLHCRSEALAVTGNPDLRLCKICGIFDDPSRLKANGKQLYHTKCLALQSRKRRARISKQEVSK
jgi:hypothetical protein